MKLTVFPSGVMILGNNKFPLLLLSAEVPDQGCETSFQEIREVSLLMTEN